MTGLNAVEVPRTEEIEQGAGLEHDPDKFRGRQLLSFFADYVCYTDGDKEELTWRQLCPKLLPIAPVSEEEAGIGEWVHAVSVAAQAPPSIPLNGDLEPQAAGGSVNNAGAGIVGPPVCRLVVSTHQLPLAMAGGIIEVGGSAVDTTTSDDRGDRSKDRALALAPAVEHCHKADDERPKAATVPDPRAAAAETFAAEDTYGAPTVPAGVAATPTLPKDTAEAAGDYTPRMEAAKLAARCASAAGSSESCMAQIGDRSCQADGCTATAGSGAEFIFLHQLEAAPSIAPHTGEASAAGLTVARNPLEAALSIPPHMAEASVARLMAAPNQLEAALSNALHTGEASAAGLTAARNQLQAATIIASHMGQASAARPTAARNQLYAAPSIALHTGEARATRLTAARKRLKAALSIAPHGGGKLCQADGCSKSVKAAPSIAWHTGEAGAARLTAAPNQPKAAPSIARHTGEASAARLTAAPNQPKAAVSIARHTGGGKRCRAHGCSKTVQGCTEYCKAHGGGKRCQADGCSKSARGSTDYCTAHGAGKRCQADGCTKITPPSIAPHMG
ncbi:hypothetical protein CYMTET_15409 [Cymbomonas tetramitiformis]|uniref:WRKY19-like zinc finger domain-containing protein n=1 Tax=Cymbomonas tetramitiformis TaxID=36881 RepID=A0AAE0GEA6_9CHLO|nr:hypothetical protein CYMTET_15409 [Cymbomonas tetramitiformis]